MMMIAGSTLSCVNRLGFNLMTPMKILATVLILIPGPVTVSMICRIPPIDPFGAVTAVPISRAQRSNVTASGEQGSQDHPCQVGSAPKDRLLGGLLASGFDESSCSSRYQSSSYRKVSPHIPSPYLVSRLRMYEDLHKRCGPHTDSYNKTVQLLKSGARAAHPPDCNYIVWISFSGLGNRILTLASAFLYSLLTGRVILVDRGHDMEDLFCEPFPNASWLLPMDFPLMNQLATLSQKSPICYGSMLKSKSVNASIMGSMPPLLYLHIVHDYDDHDKLFFCDQNQIPLKKVPWLVLKTNNYFVPSRFMIPSFEQELSRLFPQKETVFHHLGRYLLHPSNQVWGLIVRYYQAYLAKADERIGIQIRTFDDGPSLLPHVMDQILACTLKERLLPEVDAQEGVINPFMKTKRKSKAVLVTSLASGYFEMMRNMYWEHGTDTGEVIGVYQPSSEGYQQSEKKMHNRKAWAEMYLLSLTDALVTSPWSTFGYVAQGLGGLRPWILYKPENRTVPNPPCRRVVSMEPCFHSPPFYDCKAKRGADTGALVPHVRHCEDISWGLKLVDHHDEL